MTISPDPQPSPPPTAPDDASLPAADAGSPPAPTGLPSTGTVQVGRRTTVGPDGEVIVPSWAEGAPGSDARTVTAEDVVASLPGLVLRLSQCELDEATEALVDWAAALLYVPQ